jgi:hypothetical protein
MLLTPVITLGLGVLSAALVLTGGIVLFVVGRGRGALPGAGFAVLAVGTVLGSLLAAFAPEIVHNSAMSFQAFSAMYSIVQLLFDLVGWGLIIVAVIMLARSDPAAAAVGPAPGPQPGPPHGPPYGQAPPGYGSYPVPPGSGHGRPPAGPGAAPSPPGPGGPWPPGPGGPPPPR